MSKNYNEIFREIYTGDNIEAVMEILKKSGASQMETLKVLIDELRLSIRDADNVVMNANVWRQNKEINQHLKDSLANEIENFQDTD